MDTGSIIEAFPAVYTTAVIDGSATQAFLTEYAASVVDYDWFELSDFDRSPLITPRMIETYRTAPQGGRFYNFMVAMARRAFRRGLPCDAELILSLALEMDRRCGGGRRPNALHEAKNARLYAASEHRDAPPTEFEKQKRIEKEIARLSRFK